MEEFVIDGLFKVFSTLSHKKSGLGTEKDATTHVNINKNPWLSNYQVELLYYQNKIAEKVVNLLPKAALSDFTIITDSSNVSAEDIKNYLQKKHLIEAFEDTAIQGRLYGDAFLVLGLDDGQEPNQEINLERLKDLTFSYVLVTYEVSVDPQQYRNPDKYIVNISENLATVDLPSRLEIHKDRIIRLHGKKVRGRALLNTSGFNLSVLQCLLEDLSLYNQAIRAISNMLDDHAVFVYKMAGLAQKVGRKLDERLLSRVQALVTGKSVTQSLVIDKDTEEVSFISKTYSGLEPLVNKIEENLITSSGFPKSILIGSANQTALSEGGKADEKHWAKIVSEYQQNVLKRPLMRLCQYVSAILGDAAATIDITFPSLLALSEKERMEIEKLKADTAKTYIESGFLTTEELKQQDLFLVENKTEDF